MCTTDQSKQRWGSDSASATTWLYSAHVQCTITRSYASARPKRCRQRYGTESASVGRTPEPKLLKTVTLKRWLLPHGGVTLFGLDCARKDILSEKRRLTLMETCTMNMSRCVCLHTYVTFSDSYCLQEFTRTTWVWWANAWLKNIIYIRFTYWWTNSAVSTLAE